MDEYDSFNGNHLGYVIRDMQVVVIKAQGLPAVSDQGVGCDAYVVVSLGQVIRFRSINALPGGFRTFSSGYFGRRRGFPETSGLPICAGNNLAAIWKKQGFYAVLVALQCQSFPTGCCVPELGCMIVATR